VEGQSSQEILENTRCGDIQPPSERVSFEVALSLNAVCMKALSLEPGKRYSNIEGFRSEIQKFLRGFATQAEDASFAKLIRLLYCRNKVLCKIIVMALLIIGFSSLTFVHQIRKSEAQALIAKNEAEKSLELYEDERKRRKMLRLKMGDAILEFKNSFEGDANLEENFNELMVGTSIVRSRKFDFEGAMELVELALRDDPDNANALAEKGFIHLIRQEFNAANQAFSKCMTRAPHIFILLRVTQKYSGFKPDDNEQLSLKDLKQYVVDIPRGRGWLKMYVLNHQSQYYPDLMRQADLVKFYLRFNNPRLPEDFNFVYDPVKKSLDLSNNPELLILSSLGGPNFTQSSIFDTLNIKSLNISNTKVRNINTLQTLKLKSLDVRGSKVKFEELCKDANVQTIITSPGQLQFELQDMKIIERD
jgi:tetratricopeptide (TPR) repeat protein